MTPFYQECCKDLGWSVDQSLLAKMKAANEEKLKELDTKIEDAEKNLGETEIRETNLEKAEYLSLIGSKVMIFVSKLFPNYLFILLTRFLFLKDLSLEQFRKTYEKTVTLGHKLDIVFHQIRLGFFWHDFDLIKRNLDKAKT